MAGVLTKNGVDGRMKLPSPNLYDDGTVWHLLRGRCISRVKRISIRAWKYTKWTIYTSTNRSKFYFCEEKCEKHFPSEKNRLENYAYLNFHSLNCNI